MKYLYLSLLLLLTITSVSAQWISSITITPPQPTTADTITILIENTFPSGGCEGTTTLTGINGSNIIAQGMHCIGMLTVICTDYDTLIIPPQYLAIGTYIFDYTLVTGSGFPCTFGSLPSVDTIVVLQVSPATAVNEISDQATFSIFPNPSAGTFTIRQDDRHSTVKIYSMDGRVLQNFSLNGTETLVNCSLNPGIYFLSQETNGIIKRIKFVVEK
jgi:Secretion system C-terminal sorting domain